MQINQYEKKEIWKDIPGYEGLYQVSTWGNIKSLKYNKQNYSQILIPRIKKDGYLGIRLCGKSYLVHRLVGITFVSNPENKSQINHKDGNKQNNNADNLEWCTSSENILHAFHTLKKDSMKGERHGRRKLSEIEIRQINNKYKNEKCSPLDLAKEYNVSFQHIYRIVGGKTWRHINL